MPSECPRGRMSNGTRLSKASECPLCPGGYYCATPKLTSPTGVCSTGYYCPNGSVSSQEKPCLSAMHCPTGSSEPRYCEDGNYTAWEMAHSCITCPKGFYCVADTVLPGY